MKKMKRLLAVLLTFAMVLGITVLTFAGPAEASALTQAPAANGAAPRQTYVGSRPQPSDRAEAAVANVASGAAVTAYRIVEPVYSSNGFTGYRAVSGTGIANALEPTSDEVTSIAANQYLLNTLTMEPLYPGGVVDEDGLTTYSAWLGAGYWLVIVTPFTGVTTEIYNPMLIGVYYSTEGTGDNATIVSGGALNANSRWSLNSEPAYAKSEQPAIDKKITGSTGKYASDGNASGNDVAIGDTVSFEIDTQIPAYSKAYRDVRVEITDQLGRGFTVASPAALTVRVSSGAAIVSSGAAIEAVPGIDYTYTQYDDRSFQIAFTSEFSLAHSGGKVFVSYDALLGEDAGINFEANTNTAVLEYTNDPYNVNQTTRVEDRTYTYTFGIDESLYGENGSPWNQVTQELIKTGEGSAGTASGSAITASGSAIIASGSAVTASALSGAVFTLTSKDRADKVYVATSSALGLLSFAGLDAGEYELQETAAPEGYSLNDTVIPVVIAADYNEDGTLRSYSVTVAGEAVSIYTAAYQINEVTKAAEVMNVSSSAITCEIKNTRLSGLPSTGGIGTTIFTIVGCAIMVLAAALFFTSRRKSEKK